LVAETIPIAAVGALPYNTVAGHAPQILVHAILANTEAAAASPAEHEFPAATRTLLGAFTMPSFWTDGVGLNTFHFFIDRLSEYQISKSKSQMKDCNHSVNLWDDPRTQSRPRAAHPPFDIWILTFEIFPGLIGCLVV
jgi:hypothetical protein